MFRTQRCVLGMLLALAVAASGPAQAAARSKSGKAPVVAKSKKKNSKRLAARAAARAKAEAAARARAEAREKAEAEAIAAGRAAVFAFEGDETEPLRWQVVRLLRANGLRVQTDLRPTDTAEQFRDMAAALNLAVYVHGRIADAHGGHSVATVTFRSGVTGQKIATAIFQGKRRELVPMVEQGLWERVRSPLARACIEARRPGRRHNAPMRIEAGTPIEDTPRGSDGT
jgi:hypothetical protein